MNATDYFVSLRQDVMDQISGIKNASSYYSWDNTTPNYISRSALLKLFNKYAALAAGMGVLIVTRHTSCANRRHDGYPTTNHYGLSIDYLAGDYIWEGDQLYQGLRNGVCPCSSKNKETEHYVIDDFVFKGGFDPINCRAIVRILQDIFQAIENSADKRPRSAIREYLLRALLTINDSILPQTVENYIKSTR